MAAARRGGDDEHAVRPVLGKGFGRAMTIEALVATDPEHADSVLLVRRVDGEALEPARAVWWTYGTEQAEAVAASGSAGFTIEPGCVYRLRGYEVGSWSGYVWIGGEDLRPEHASGVGFDDFGPRAAIGCGFCNEFRVVTGTLVERGTLRSADPFGLSRYGKRGEVMRGHRPHGRRP